LKQRRSFAESSNQDNERKSERGKERKIKGRNKRWDLGFLGDILDGNLSPFNLSYLSLFESGHPLLKTEETT
jgi:hypothetical protein